MSRATVDLQAVRFFLGYGLIFFSQHVLTVVIVLIALSLLNVELTLIAIAIAPVLMVMAYRYSRISHPILKEVQQRVADVTTQAEENVVGVRVVKAFAQEQHETDPLPRRLRADLPAGHRRRPAAGPLRAGDVGAAQPGDRRRAAGRRPPGDRAAT